MDERELEQVFHDAQAGIQAARERIWVYCLPLLRARAQWFATFPLQFSDVEDLVQETLRAVLVRLAVCQWRGQRAFHGWIYRVLRHQKSDWLKRQTRKRRDVRREMALPPDDPETSSQGTVDQLPDPFPSPVDELIHQEILERLTEAVQGLPQRQQQILTLRYTEGLRWKEVAHRLNRPCGSVRNEHTAILQTLRRGLNP